MTKKKNNVDDILELLPMQEGMLFNTVTSENNDYSIEHIIHLAGTINEANIRIALEQITRAIPALRSAILYEQVQRPVQVVLAMRAADYEYHDIRRTKTDFKTWWSQHRHLGFDLAHKPLWRVRLVRIDDENYRMIWCYHHILLDGWSFAIVLDDFFKSYITLQRGASTAITSRTSTKEYLTFINNLPKAATADYWREYLQEHGQAHASPIVKWLTPTNPQKTSAVLDYHQRRLGHQLNQDINALRATLKITSNTFMQTTWGILLAKYNNDSDVTFGSTVSGRPYELPGAEQMVGMFINTVPVRVRFDTDTTCKDLLGKCQQDFLQASKHSLYPLNSILATHSGKIKFDHVTVFENFPVNDDVLAPIADEVRLAGQDVYTKTNFLLTVEFNTDADDYQIIFGFDPGHVDTQLVQRLADHYTSIVTQIISNPDRLVSEIHLTQGVRFEDDLASTPGSIVERFSEVARQFSTKPALIRDGRVVSYGELNRMTDILASHLLSEYGVTAGSLVGILTGKDESIVIAMLAIMKAGAAFVPINSDWPENRRHFVVEDAALRVILNPPGLADSQAFTVPVVPLHDALLTGNERIVELPQVSQSSLAYVIYTSGSTGYPKGVMVEHGGVVNMALSQIRIFGISENDRVLQFAPFSFDAAVSELLMSLFTGASLVLVPESVIKDVDLFREYSIRHRATVVTFPPSYLKNFTSDQLEFLRVIISAGERVPAEVAGMFASNCAFFNAYGPTEYSVCVTTHRVHATTAGKTIPIGVPIKNTHVYVMDEYLNVLPEGLEGELCFAGLGLARGYLNNPELTFEKFVTHPSGVKMYRSGDIGMLNHDGTYEFIGRKDEQVKINGYRIETEEVAFHLRQFEGVRDAIVVSDSTGTQLHAFVVPDDPGHRVSYETLRHHLSVALPAYMLPHVITEIPEIPLTLHGKADKTLLRERRQIGHNRSKEGARTDVEGRILHIWKELLGKEDIGIHDNYYEIGGDSMIAIRMVSRLRKEDVQISVKQIMSHQTVANLAAVAASPDTLSRGDDFGQVPLTSIQHEFFAGISTENRDRLNSFSFTIVLGSLSGFDHASVGRALNAVLKRHEVFGYEYETGHSPVRQFSRILANVSAIPVVNTTNAEDTIEKVFTKLKDELDIAKGSLVRCALVKMHDGDKLLCVFHHLIMDVVSAKIFVDEFRSAYTDAEQFSKTARRSASFRHWAQSAEEFANTRTGQEYLQFWKKATSRQMPSLVPAVSVNPVFHLDHVKFEAEATSSFLTNVCRATTPNEALITLLADALRQTFSQPRLQIQVESHGREIAGMNVDISETVGWFTSSYPLYIDFTDRHTWMEKLDTVTSAVRSIPDKGFGYGLLKAEYKPHTATSFSLPQVNFNYDGFFPEESSEGGIFLLHERLGIDNAKFDKNVLLYINAIVINDRLRVDFEYEVNTIGHDNARTLIRNFSESFAEQLRLCSSSPAETGNGYAETANRYPLSPTQVGLMFLHLKEPDATAYHTQTYTIIKGDLDVRIFQSSFAALTNKFDVFKTRFGLDEHGIPFQEVDPRIDNAIEFLDISHHVPEERNEIESRIRNEEHMRRFHLLSGEPLIRIFLIKRSQAEFGFLLSFHHILMDAWCADILFHELFSAYTHLKNNRTILKSKAPSYREYISWLSRFDQNDALRFWNKYFEGLEPSGNWNTYKVAQGSHRVMLKVTQEFGVDKLRMLQGIAADSHTTVFVLLEVIWGILLSNYFKTKDVVFGKILNGRPDSLEGVDQMVGLFINTIPQRIRWSDDMKFSDLLKSIDAQQCDLRDFQYVSLAEIQVESGAENLLFDHLVEFDIPSENAALTEADLNFETQSVTDEVHYDLNTIFTIGKSLSLTIVYDASSFRANFIADIISQLRHLVDQVIESPDRLLKHFDLVTHEVRRKICEINSTVTPLPALLPHELITQWCTKTPDAIAMKFNEQVVRYSEMEDWSNNIASWMIAHGIEKGAIVPVIGKRSPDLVVAMLGIMRSGAVYLPLDTDTPVMRLLDIFHDCGATLAFTDGSFDSNELLRLCPSLEIADIKGVSRIQQPRAQMHATKFTDSAYVIYTSGSTGKPKGVVIEHLGMLNHLQSKIALCDLNTESVVIQNAPHTFDISVWQILAPLMTGGQIVIVDDETIKYPPAFLKSLGMVRPHVLEVVPSYLEVLLDDTLKEQAAVIDSIDHFLITGEKPKVSVVRHFLERFTHPRLINAYGPTEASDDVTHALLNGRTLEDGIPVGYPIQNMRVYILGSNMNFCPPGIKGDLFVGGIGVGKGYLNNPEKTVDVFLADVFVAGEKMYKTGDVAEYMSDFSVKFHGREDTQVKVNGNRIELADIEFTLHKIKGVTGVVVELINHATSDASIRAFITGDGSLTFDAFQREARQLLPAYMVPADVQFLEFFPLTKNGKIDRAELRARAGNSVSEASKNLSSIESTLLSIWQSVLGKADIAIDESFFQIGGHSLKAIQIVTRIGGLLNVELTIKDFFAHPTITELARLIKSREKTNVPPPSAAPNQNHYELSDAQKRLWIVNSMIEERHVYNISTSVELQGEVESFFLEKSLRHLINRHESLRTNFIARDGDVYQFIKSYYDCSFQLGFIDLSGEIDMHSRAESYIHQFSNTHFDLERDLLIRAALIRLSDQRHLLVVVLHHIIADGWSMAILSDELKRAYAALTRGEDIQDNPIDLQYKDFAFWQRRLLEGESLVLHKNYWLKKLDGVSPPFEIPFSNPRPALKTYQGSTVHFKLSSDITRKMAEISARQEGTTFNMLLSILNVLFFRYTGSEDITLGITSSGRPHATFEKQVGYFINTIPLRTTFSRTSAFTELFNEVKSTVLEALSHQMYPLERIVDDLKLDRNSKHSPLFDILIEYQNLNITAAHEGQIDVPLKFVPHHVDTNVSKFDLTFFFIHELDSIDVAIEFNTDLFDRDAIIRLSEHFQNLLTAFIANPAESISKVQLVSKKEIELLREWNNTTEAFDDIGHNVLDLFLDNVIKNPDSVAVRSSNGVLTYRQLHDSALCLAENLRQEHKVEPGQVIPVMMDNSENLLIAFIGVWMADCAFLPINVNDPVTRKKFILDECRCTLLITDSQVMLSVQQFFNHRFIALDVELPLMSPSPHRTFPPLSNRLSYVIYTSGSTGRPKGVKVPHSSLFNYVTWANNYYFANDDRRNFALFTNPSFDLTLTSIFCPLSNGAEVVIFTGNMSDVIPEAFSDTHSASIVKATPSHLQYLSFAKIRSNRIHTVILGGEPLRANHLNWLYALNPDIRIFNEYGPTEATIGCTVEAIHECPETDTITIGSPIANTRIYIMDEFLNLQPLGVPGELCVSGDCLAIGYVDNGLDAERFSEADVLGERVRIYRTGDQARWLPTGKLEMLGRLDRQVKRNGYRIELDEIERALGQHEDITQCTVIQMPVNQQVEIVAYFTARATLTADVLLQFLRKRIPTYYLPDRFMSLKEIPLTVNGKVDHANLPNPAVSSLMASLAFAPLETETQRMLAGLWESVLNVENIGKHDDFFQLGGNSLKVVQLVNALDQSPYQGALKVTDFFNNAVLAELAALIDLRHRQLVPTEKIEDYDL